MEVVNLKFNISLFFLSLFLIVNSVNAATYYVDYYNGNDNNVGSQQQPWRTISRAETIMRAGDTVIVHPGVYNERVSIRGISGTSFAPITYQAEDGVIMLGFDIYENYTNIINFKIINSSSSGIYLQGSYNTIKNNYIYNPYGYGIEIGTHGTDWEKDPLMYTRGTNNLISNNTIVHAITAGIITYGENNIIEYNDISRTWQGPNVEDADGLRFLGRNHVIRYNYIHDINTTESPEAHSDCYQSWGPAYNILFEHNICYLPYFEFQGLMLEHLADSQGRFSPVDNITFKYNVWRFSRPGITYSPGLTVTAKENQKSFGNIYVDHNTFIRDTPGQYAVWFNNNTNIVIKNNIFYNGVSGMYPENQNYIAGNIVRIRMPASEIIADYNLVYRSDGINLTASSPTFGVPKGTHDIWNVNPNFNDIASLDFRPRTKLADGQLNPVCSGGEGGTFIGAFPCVNATIFNSLADLNNDGCVSLSEISAFVARWLNGEISLGDVSGAVSLWLNGC
ncbi:MAG: hypothetical protein KatS3mg002_0144 [Candidatus Woesearchaeota archaeon]|nr:MAG: hypothetical protein KatS3mg002_0144 [Candidatus Woesearchaeota archaeon]